jgi:hypothetical protein
LFSDRRKNVIRVDAIEQLGNIGIVLVTDALTACVPEGIDGTELSVLSKEFQDLVAMLFFQIRE